MSAHFHCRRGPGGAFQTAAAEISQHERERAVVEELYMDKTAAISVLIAQSSTVFDADGNWSEIVEPATTWQAAYDELARKAVEQHILLSCTRCFEGHVWVNRNWVDCPTCNGVGYVPVQVADQNEPFALR
jgi:hypothetical protein